MKPLELILAMLFVFAAVANAAPGRQIIGSEYDHSAATAETTDCEHFYKTTFTSFRSQMNDQEQHEINLTGISTLKVLASEEGGVSIRGWDRPFARLIICRFAVANTKSQAMRVLSAINVSHAKGEIAAYGPPTDATQAWWVNMILYVPRRATVDVRAANGGVAIRHMSGNVTAHATTGGISVAQSSGHYKISTNSGGITLERVTGHVEAASQDGAIALKFAPSEMPSVEAKIADSGEILCTLRGCAGGQWTPDRKLLRMGDGAPDFRLSTTAAPIIIGPVTS